MKSLLSFIVLGILSCLFALSLVASDHYAYEVTSTAQFGVVDLDTGVFTQISTLATTIGGLGVAQGSLYGMHGNMLYRINPGTGRLTAVGNPATFTYAGLGSTTSGLYGFDPSMNLYSIDPVSGATTLIGSTGLRIPGGFGVSTGADDLYVTISQPGCGITKTALYSINTKTAEAHGIRQTDLPCGSGALVSENGTLYAGGNISPVATYTLSTANGTSTFVAHVAGTMSYFYGLADKGQVGEGPTGPTPNQFSISIPSNKPWTPTGITLEKEQMVTISARGEIIISDHNPPMGPNGTGVPCYPNPEIHYWHFPAQHLSCASLIGRIGELPPFEVGSYMQFRAPAAGPLWLGVNDNWFADNYGSWEVIIATKN